MTKDIVYQIAEYAREWAEAYDEKYDISCSGDLCGMCSIASAFLFRELKRAGIPTTIEYSDYHFFVVAEGLWLVDVTATQFDLPEVETFAPINVSAVNDVPKSYWFWQSTRKLNSLKELFLLQDELGWHRPQRATYHRLNLNVLG